MVLYGPVAENPEAAAVRRASGAGPDLVIAYPVAKFTAASNLGGQLDEMGLRHGVVTDTDFSRHANVPVVMLWTKKTLRSKKYIDALQPVEKDGRLINVFFDEPEPDGKAWGGPAIRPSRNDAAFARQVAGALAALRVATFDGNDASAPERKPSEPEIPRRPEEPEGSSAVNRAVAETEAFERISDSRKADDYRAFLEQYGDGAFADIARRRLAALLRAAETEAEAEPAEPEFETALEISAGETSTTIAADPGSNALENPQPEAAPQPVPEPIESTTDPPPAPVVPEDTPVLVQPPPPPPPAAARANAGVTDVFLSYRSTEKDFARDLARFLLERGFNVWWDAALLAGQDFAQIVHEEVRKARAVVVMWSREALSSHWVRSEASIARTRKSLINTVIDDLGFEDLPEEFRSIQAVRLEPGRQHEFFEAIVRAIRAKGIEPSHAARNPLEALEELERQREAAKLFFDTIKDSENPEEYRIYLTTFGDDAAFAAIARARIKWLEEKAVEQDRRDAETRGWLPRIKNEVGWWVGLGAGLVALLTFWGLTWERWFPPPTPPVELTVRSADADRTVRTFTMAQPAKWAEDDEPFASASLALDFPDVPLRGRLALSRRDGSLAVDLFLGDLLTLSPGTQAGDLVPVDNPIGPLSRYDSVVVTSGGAGAGTALLGDTVLCGNLRCIFEVDVVAARDRALPQFRAAREMTLRVVLADTGLVALRVPMPSDQPELMGRILADPSVASPQIPPSVPSSLVLQPGEAAIELAGGSVARGTVRWEKQEFIGVPGRYVAHLTLPGEALEGDVIFHAPKDRDGDVVVELSMTGIVDLGRIEADEQDVAISGEAPTVASQGNAGRTLVGGRPNLAPLANARLITVGIEFAGRRPGVLLLTGPADAEGFLGLLTSPPIYVVDGRDGGSTNG
jgi:hypothetical protein